MFLYIQNDKLWKKFNFEIYEEISTIENDVIAWSKMAADMGILITARTKVQKTKADYTT